MGEHTGLLLLNKKPGLTSFESLKIVKKALNTRKVGHTGTLDKFASGLLVVLAGRALKLTPWFDRCDKQYEGVIRFGVETDTLDPEGATVAEAAVPSREALERVLPQFRGNILQAPPAYSAIHIDGKRAHELARSGVAVEMEKRPVTIYKLELRSYDPPLAKIHVHCSKGTYIRSLARDLALAAGSRAHLVSLERTRVAGFDLARAVSPELPAKLPADSPDLAAALQPIGVGIFDRLGLPWFTVDGDIARSMIHGKPLDTLLANSGITPGDSPVPGPSGPSRTEAAAVFCGGDFVAVIEKKGGGSNRWSYGYVNAHS
jgi:tRNA pseudouridine55 synthase